MPLFKKQPGFCCICGKPGEYEPHGKFGFICGYRDGTMKYDCMDEYNWRHTLYVLGKDYYPRETNEEEQKGLVRGRP